ncbi:MAG: phage tail assembly protein [Betaproteobacteria bacterium]|nr:phage tail assembly protein [Betaproteobacteria bacterium]
MEPTEIVFDEPVKLGSAEYPSITLREPKAGELEKAEKYGGGLGFIITLAHLVAGVPRRVIEELPRHELNKITDFFNGSPGAL